MATSTSLGYGPFSDPISVKTLEDGKLIVYSILVTLAIVYGLTDIFP